MRRVVPPRLASARDSKSLPASDRHIEPHPARARASRARDATRNDGDRRAVVHGRRRATANGSARVLRRENRRVGGSPARQDAESSTLRGAEK